MLASNGMHIQFDRMIKRKLNWIELHPDSLLSLCSHRLTAALLKVIGNRLHKTQKLESDRSFETDDFKGNGNMEVIHFVYQFSRHFLRRPAERFLCTWGQRNTKAATIAYKAMKIFVYNWIHVVTVTHHSFQRYFVDLKIQTKPLKTHPRNPNPENKQFCHAWIVTLVSQSQVSCCSFLLLLCLELILSGCPFAVKFRSQLTWPSVTSSAEEQSAGLGDFLGDFASSYWEV